jgi:release factor glutamine methyltransferase
LSSDPVAEAARRFAGAGIESARLDARLLWQFARDVELSALVAPSTGRAETLFASLVERRLTREPLAYIVGRKEFWSLDFAVGPGVLIPRPDSETLIDSLRKSFPDKAARLSILDLGTGSGCLLVAALTEYPLARGVGVDSSEQALAWAARNIATHKLEARATLVHAGWLEEATPGFDVVLCNPPYIATSAIAGLAPEVRLFEPTQALDGGRDGLDAYRDLGPRIGKLLAPGGLALLEMGAGQETEVSRILQDNKLRVLRLIADLAGIPRCVAAVNTA